METELKKAFTWEIDNLSENREDVCSDAFSSGGCEWYIVVSHDDYLSVYLAVMDPIFLSLGWKRKANYYFVVSNQSGKELWRSPETRCRDFCHELYCWGFPKIFPLHILQEEENNKLTIQVYMNVLEVVHQGNSTANDITDCFGFEVVASQFHAVEQIFFDHPDFVNVEYFRSKDNVEWTTCINILLRLIETLHKPPASLLDSELNYVHNELRELQKGPFMLDWLVTKLEDVSVERKKTKSRDSYLQKLEERIKYLELTISDLQDEMDKEKIKSATDKKVYSFEFIDFFVKRFFLSCFSISKH